jgi:osmotically-inducible protein OsmY
MERPISVGSERGPRPSYDRSSQSSSQRSYDRGSGMSRQRDFGRDYDREPAGRYYTDNESAERSGYGSSTSLPNTGYETGSRGWDEIRSPGSSYGVYDIGGQGAPGYGREANGTYDDVLDRQDWRADQEARNWRLDRDMHHQEHGFFERLGEKVGEFFGKGPKNYKRSDERIREDVSEALYRHPYIDASDIEVTVSEGVVTLSGTVHERAMKRMSEDEAEKISGVKDVNNSIRVSDANMSRPFSATPDESRKDRPATTTSGSKRIQ